MKAVVEINNQQYLVEEGKILYVDSINADVDSILTFDKILLFNHEFGYPYVKNCQIKAKVLKHGKKKKIIVLKHKPKKHHVVRQGHRQKYTMLEIQQIIKGDQSDNVQDIQPNK